MLPEALNKQIDMIGREVEHKSLVFDAENISKKYRYQSGMGKVLVSDYNETVAYAISRMPATFEACLFSLKQVCKRVPNLAIESLLDVGAGTGTASWAVDSIFNTKKIVCLEREDNMLNLGSKLAKNGSQNLQNSIWKKCDIVNDKIMQKYDLVLA